MDINNKIEYFRKRTDNFVTDSLPNIDYNDPKEQEQLNYFFNLKEEFFKAIESDKSITPNTILIAAFSCIYEAESYGTIMNPLNSYERENDALNSNLFNNVYEACLFFALFVFCFVFFLT